MSQKILSNEELQKTEPAFKCTGIFIPIEVLKMEGLNKTDKLMLAYIDALDGPDHCYASNAHLASLMEISLDRVSRIVSKLKTLGLIKDLGMIGTRRILMSLKQNWFTIRKTEVKVKNSKNFSLVRTTTLPRCEQQPSPVANNNHIDKKIDKYNNLPLVPQKNDSIDSRSAQAPSAKEPQQRAAATAAAPQVGGGFLEKIIKERGFSEADKQKLRNYSEEELNEGLDELDASKGVRNPIALLLTILRKPKTPSEEPEMFIQRGKLSFQQNAAMKHNKVLRDHGYSRGAELNNQKIPNNIMFLFDEKGGITQISLALPLEQLAEDFKKSTDWVIANPGNGK